ncbi:proprotein convertase P-domain-containing protein [Devosia sp.]|uniref:proprotein convertase P-domain-containing protein n=1 Tax=Devosia sp. TaxID=1871048 RepID=UPI002FC731CD
MLLGMLEELVADWIRSIWGETMLHHAIFLIVLVSIVALSVFFSTIWKQFSVFVGKSILSPFFSWVFGDMKNTIIFVLVLVFSVYIFYNSVVGPMLREFEMDSNDTTPEIATQNASDVEQNIDPRAGLTKYIDFPLAGEIVAGSLSFSFSVECENDYYATLTSPTGQSQSFMDRGLNRCSGQTSTFTSHENSMETFVGAEAFGKWAFNIRDADSNAHSGSLVSLRLSLSVSDGGNTITNVVSAEGVPASIPN